MTATDRRQGLYGGGAIKLPCRVATTANITLSGLQTIDGVTVVADDRVLVKNQTTATQNGIYIADSGTWSRARDFDGMNDCVQGTLVLVTSGTVNASSIYELTTSSPVIGTSNLTFVASGSAALNLASAFMLTVLDDTTAAAARTTLGAAASADLASYLPLSVIDAAADLIVGTAADTAGRLAKGTALQYLRVNSGATALEWADVVLPKMHIYGLTYANNSGDATNDLDIAVGGCMDATGAKWIQVAALTKQSDAAWAVGSAAGGLDTGAVGNNDYYIWAILRSDTGVTDILFSLSSTAPTMPTNYDYKRLIGWFKRSGGSIVAFKTYETEGGGLEYIWTVPTLDVNLANTLTTSGRTDAIRVPLTFSTVAHINVQVFDASSNFKVWVYNPDHTSAAPSGSAAPLANITPPPGTSLHEVQLRIRTSATGTIGARADLATVDEYRVSTLGFEWSRR